MVDQHDKKRYVENLAEELNAAALYKALAESEKNPKLAEVYRRLAATEEGHAKVWRDRLEAAGEAPPVFKPSWRTRTFAWVAKRFGVEAILPTLASIETGATNTYANQPEAKAMASEEKSHAVLLQEMSKTTSQGMTGGKVAQLEGRHKTAGGNALRAAVLGASDGLGSTFILGMGVAGAISMALGEWISVQSSRELYQKQIRTEQEEIAASPEEETE